VIDVKMAAKKAKEYAQEMYGGDFLGLPMGLPSVLLEEVERSDDGRFWYVTLGWDADRLGTKRIYKVFKIRADDGEVVSMKIRTLQ
jgi:hypothetical protein